MFMLQLINKNPFGGIWHAGSESNAWELNDCGLGFDAWELQMSVFGVYELSAEIGNLDF